MAVINKQFIQFAKKATLQKHWDANEILPTSIVFVKETGEIFVNGVFYSNNTQTEANTTAIETIKEQSGWWIEPELCTITTSFDSNSTIIYFEEGMTWGEWINSKYNNVTFDYSSHLNLKVRNSGNFIELYQENSTYVAGLGNKKGLYYKTDVMIDGDIATVWD